MCGDGCARLSLRYVVLTVSSVEVVRIFGGDNFEFGRSICIWWFCSRHELGSKGCSGAPQLQTYVSRSVIAIC